MSTSSIFYGIDVRSEKDVFKIFEINGFRKEPKGLVKGDLIVDFDLIKQSSINHLVGIIEESNVKKSKDSKLFF